MIKKLSFMAVLALSAQLPAHALATGDIAFTAFNADEDGWAIVALTGLAANTTVYFSDNTFSAGAFANTESFLTWTTGPSAIAAGTVVRFIGQNNGSDYTSVSASVGNLVVTVDGNAGLSATAETLYAYQASAYNAASPTFLAAVSSEGGALATTALGNAGLTAGVNAVSLTASTDFAEYTGLRTGQTAFSAYASLVNNAANWTGTTTGANELVVPNTTAFAIAAVPEPETYALMLAGLASLGFMARRHTRGG